MSFWNSREKDTYPDLTAIDRMMRDSAEAEAKRREYEAYNRRIEQDMQLQKLHAQTQAMIQSQTSVMQGMAGNQLNSGLLGGMQQASQWQPVAARPTQSQTSFDQLKAVGELLGLDVSQASDSNWSPLMSEILLEIVRRTNIAVPIKNENDLVSALVEAKG